MGAKSASERSPSPCLCFGYSVMKPLPFKENSVQEHQGRANSKHSLVQAPALFLWQSVLTSICVFVFYRQSSLQCWRTTHLIHMVFVLSLLCFAIQCDKTVALYTLWPSWSVCIPRSPRGTSLCFLGSHPVVALLGPHSQWNSSRPWPFLKPGCLFSALLYECSVACGRHSTALL